jgi:DNA-binding MarR family transcriptional regulator
MDVKTIRVKSSQPLKYIQTALTQLVMKTGHSNTNAKQSFKVITPTVLLILEAIRCLHSHSQRVIAAITAAIMNTKTIV